MIELFEYIENAV